VSDRADVQLRRILLALPYLADGNEHDVAEMAEHIGCPVPTLLRDLTTLLARDFTPAGFVEGVQVYLTGSRVTLVSKTFHRPMRLSATEMAAIDLGLAMLASERAPDERPAIERARAHLAELRVGLPADVRDGDIRAASLATIPDLPHLSTLQAAAKDRRQLRLRYQRGSGGAVSEREVHPYALLHAEGMWYLAAYCESSSDLRIFRVDRIVDATLLADTFERPATWSVEDVVNGRRVLRTDTTRRLRVRYGPRVARWIIEREEATAAPDGSVEVEYPLADESWVLRHVLQYGPDAEVVEPAEMRAAVRERLASMLARAVGDAAPPA